MKSLGKNISMECYKIDLFGVGDEKEENGTTIILIKYGCLFSIS